MAKVLPLFIMVLMFIHNSLCQDYERYRKLSDTTIESEHLGFEKNITVTVPFEWQHDLGRDFPLIIVFDRQNTRSHNYILNTIDYLTSNEQMPSSIIISVESDSRHRYKETLHQVSSENGLAAENEKFIFEELIPLAENEFNASDFRLLVGHSRYGYFTSALFCSRTNDLTGVISISPFYKQANVDLTDSIADLNGQAFVSKKYYRYGIGDDFPDDFNIMDSTLGEFNNPSIDTKGFFFEEADHNATPGLTIGISLYEIFQDWSRVQSKYLSPDQEDLTTVDTFLDEIARNYGSSPVFSLGVLNGKGWSFYNEGKPEKAIEAWEVMMKYYPNFSEGYLYMIDAKLKLEQDYSETSKRFHESLAESAIYNDTQKDELIKELESLE